MFDLASRTSHKTSETSTRLPWRWFETNEPLLTFT